MGDGTWYFLTSLAWRKGAPACHTWSDSSIGNLQANQLHSFEFPKCNGTKIVTLWNLCGCHAKNSKIKISIRQFREETRNKIVSNCRFDWRDGGQRFNHWIDDDMFCYCFVVQFFDTTNTQMSSPTNTWLRFVCIGMSNSHANIFWQMWILSVIFLHGCLSSHVKQYANVYIYAFAASKYMNRKPKANTFAE